MTSTALKDSIKPILIRDKAYVNGQWVGAKSGETFDVRNPATGEFLARVPEMGPEDVRLAIDAAHKSFSSFKGTPNRSRADLLTKCHQLMLENVEDLARIVTLENGKPLAEARGEVLYSASFLQWFAEEAPRLYGSTIPSAKPNIRIHTLRQPIGVCGVVTPWNFPSAMITRKMAAAIAAGCTCVIKPAAETPLSALALGQLVEMAGVPPGVVNFVTADKNTVAIGELLSSDSIVKKLTFTGSTLVGKLLMKQAASTLKKCSFELGGNAPFIVFDDADLESAVQGALIAKFRGTGQTCICVNRIYVQRGVYEEFCQKLAKSVSELVPGNGLHDGVSQGPVINAKALAKVQEHVQDALEQKGRLLVGGRVLDNLGSTFYAPTVIADGHDGMRVFHEETFGPLAVIQPFDDETRCLEAANDTELGLAAYVYTKDVSRAHRWSEGLETGMVGINTSTITEAALPFGGVKESGFGREGSRYGLDDYTVVKSVVTSVSN